MISFSGAAAPGPLMMVAMVRGLRQGAQAGIWVAVGHAALESILVAAIAIGLVQAVQSSVWEAGIAVVGGLVLLAMGGVQLTSAGRGQATIRLPDRPEAGVTARRWRTWWGALGAGIAATAGNPYWYVWWLTVGAALVDQARSAGWGALLPFFAAHGSADAVWLVLVAAVASRGRTSLNERGYRLLLTGLAVLLMLFGLFFAHRGMRQLLA